MNRIQSSTSPTTAYQQLNIPCLPMHCQSIRTLSNTTTKSNSWNFSFSGAGHLLSYHLGAARTFLDDQISTTPIQSVAGSSSGAIAAAVLACMPDRLGEYTDCFLKDGGRAFANFDEMISHMPLPSANDNRTTNHPILHIATTKCSGGSRKIFSFDPSNLQIDKLLQALQASCYIPLSFHPWNVFSKSALSYPEHDGIKIKGNSYVDGGIASPAPIVSNNGANVIIGPISGSSKAEWSICLIDDSWKLPLIGDLDDRCGTFAVRPSADNLRALVVSAAASLRVLKDWYERGADDANRFLEEWDDSILHV